MEAKRNRIKIAKKEQKDYLNAALSAFENYDVVELSAAGSDKVMMSRIAFLLCNVGLILDGKRTEHIEGNYHDDDTYPITVLILRNPNAKKITVENIGGVVNG